MSILEEPMVFVDIETTGLSFARGREIEVAAIRVENNSITDSFTTLVDPQSELPPFITGLTGISGSDLRGAPTFYDISDRLFGIMEGAVFVAHNVRFDYGFLKHEFGRAGRKFSPKQLCTVRLSKALYPADRGHKLQDLITRCHLEVAVRHRAYDDAQAMWQFIQHIESVFPAPLIQQAINLQIKWPSLPKNLDSRMVKELPDAPGVYIFEDEQGRPLYIGKSVSIRKRVLSHFSADHEAESEFKISQQISNIDFIRTAGELEALLLESKLIKERQPLYNRQLRRRQKLTLTRRTYDENGYMRLEFDDVAVINPDSIGDILGVYSTKGKAKDFISQVSKDFGLCPRLLGLENGRGACFSYQLKRCAGACCGKETPEQFNNRLIAAFDGRRLHDWPYSSPVLIEEKTDDDTVSSIVIDKWCVVAQISQQPECEPQVKLHEKMFDIDTYKILRSYIMNRAQRLVIRPVPLEWVRQLA
jgi:DNA polymerase-3 subunit epsilon